MEYIIEQIEGIITFKNQNTTLGFVRFNEEAEIEYIYVQNAYRRQGLGKKLLNLVKETTGKEVTPQDPISPLGDQLFKSIRN
jgi:ribosomal protein S18 acetylase RimI-like enzyme